MERGKRRNLISEFIVAERLCDGICNELLSAGFDIETELVGPAALWEFMQRKIRVYEITE